MADQSQDTALIDVHAHFLTDHYVCAAQAASVTHPDGMAMWPNWSVEEHLRLIRCAQQPLATPHGSASSLDRDGPPGKTVPDTGTSNGTPTPSDRDQT